MADILWQNHTELAEAPNAADDVLLRDVSDTTADPAGTVKRNSIANLFGSATGLVEQISGHIETATNKSYVLDQSAAYAYTINSLIIDAVSGTCTVKLTIDGVDVTGISAVSVSSTEATGTASGANSVPVGGTVALVISANAAALDVAFTVKITR